MEVIPFKALQHRWCSTLRSPAVPIKAATRTTTYAKGNNNKRDKKKDLYD